VAIKRQGQCVRIGWLVTPAKRVIFW
jgi:hypothetical protein